MRYDAQEHLDAWRDRRAWPEVHDDLFNLVLAESRGRRFLDLCCSTGLLAQRLKDKLPGCEHVLGVDTDGDALDRACAAGVSVSLYQLSVTLANLKPLCALVTSYGITSLVARRCFPEVFTADRSWAPALIESLAAAGIREVFIQGRASRAKATHPLSSVEAEIQALGSSVKVLQVAGQCAYLVPVRILPWP